MYVWILTRTGWRCNTTILCRTFANEETAKRVLAAKKITNPESEWSLWQHEVEQ